MRLSHRSWGLGVGAVVTATVAFIYLWGGWNWLSLPFLDFSFRHANRIDADPRIVLIDINDAALQRIHRWPWPRRMQADLVNVLAECGAEAILLDLIYAEATGGRIIHPALDPDYDIESTVEIYGDVSLDQAIRDDQELADAIERAGNVYVAMYLRLADPDADTAQQWSRARKFIDENPDLPLEQFASRLEVQPKSDARRLWIQVRMDRALRRDFSLGADELARKLRVDEDQIEQHISLVKELAARKRVNDFLESAPDADFRALRRNVLPNLPADTETPDIADLRRVFRRALALRAATQHRVDPDPAVRRLIPTGYDVMPPIAPIANAAKRVGFVSFRTDADGVLRHVPLAVDVDGQVLLQLACAMAADQLGIDWSAATLADGRKLVLKSADGNTTWRAPLSQRGEVLLNWHIDRSDPRWQASFTHITASRVMEVALARRSIEENILRLRRRLGRAVQIAFEDAQSVVLDYERLVRERSSFERNAKAVPTDLTEHIQKLEHAAISQLKSLHQEMEGVEPESAEEGAFFGKIRDVYATLIENSYAETIKKKNRALAQRADQLVEQLVALIEGKLCFVGHTAAAQADMVNTPVFEDMPGVMAHANLVNMLLAKRIPSVASRGIHLILIIAAGLMVTLLASTRGPWVTFVTVLLSMALFVGASLGCMLLWGYFVAGVVPTVGIFICWSLITLYRQLTEQRQKRSFARELSRNTSPAIAVRLAQNLDHLDLSPQPAQVTCYFSDLEGFTSISERSSADQTQAMLNRYLGVMGETLVELKAFNKFMGDGIFAFFNSPILPLENHAQVACNAALATADRLEKLKDEQSNGPSEQFARLRMRIGLHTGPAFVGYFGSENQSDYTCIGDTVNLAARLEAANKAFGTCILVSQPCADAGGAGLAFRPLGKLQVKGKAHAVAVNELLGSRDQVSTSQLDYAERFAEGISLFQRREWKKATDVWVACKAARPEDAAVVLYAELTDHFSNSPPPDDWNQAIVLTSK